MQSHAFIDHTDEINSIYALIPIIAYCYQLDGHLTDLQIRKVVKWFFYAQIRTRYVSQLPQKLDRDLKVIKDSSQPFDDLLQIIKDERTLEISPDEFVGRAISHPLYPMMRWYFKSKGATCFTTGIKRSEEHTSELQSLMRISYAVYCLKKQQQACKVENRLQSRHTSYRR